MVPLFNDGKPIEGAEDHFIEGELDQCVIASVPESISEEMATIFKNKLQDLFGKPAVVVTHNITLMKAVKLSPNEAARVIKDGEDYAEARANAIATLGATPEEMGLGSDAGGNGRGSGDGLDGDHHSEEGAPPEAAMPGDGSGPDEESGEEGPSRAEGDS